MTDSSVIFRVSKDYLLHGLALGEGVRRRHIRPDLPRALDQQFQRLPPVADGLLIRGAVRVRDMPRRLPLREADDIHAILVRPLDYHGVARMLVHALSSPRASAMRRSASR